jgi:hypothetical protein
MKSTSILFFAFLGLAIHSCCRPEKKDQSKTEKAISPNPLDTILGEKWLTDESIRPANFEQIIHIPAEFLRKESEVYEIKKLNSEFYLLNQKKNVGAARPYSLLLKTDGKQITAFKTVNDYNIKKAFIRNKMIYALGDDFKQGRTAWKPKCNILVSGFDLDLKEKWSYTNVYYENPFEAEDLEFINNSLVAKIHVIEGCHICYSTVGLTFSNEGKIMACKLLYKPVNGPDLTKAIMKSIFREE